MINLKKTYIIILLIFLTSGISAQTYDLIERRNPWNRGANVTGIRMDSITISYAEAYKKNVHGDFKDSYEADKGWKAGVVAKSIIHLKKYSMIGSFSFEHASGRNMNGSMFMKPRFYPVDVLEFTPGRKTLQTYSFMGGIAVDVDPKWSVGGKIDFVSANYAKRKDLRHTNYRLELEVAPSIMYRSDNKAMGLSYIFRKNRESVEPEEIGTKETSYYAFLDKGLMYGAYEEWTGSGVHLNESGISGFPIKEISNGASLQVQYDDLYADVKYLYSFGSIGEKSTIWFEFPSHNISSRFEYQIRRGDITHFARLNITWSYLENNESVLEKKTENGITKTHIYGSNRIFERDIFSINPEYEIITPRWELQLGVNISSIKSLASQMYPHAIYLSITCCNAYITGVLHHRKFDFKYGLSFSKGTLTEKKRKVDIETDNSPYHLTNYYNLQNEFMIAPKTDVSLGIRYNFFKGLYAELEARVIHGSSLKYINGSYRWHESVKLGYNF